MQKYKKRKKPRQHDSSKVSNAVGMASSESKLDKIVGKNVQKDDCKYVWIDQKGHKLLTEFQEHTNNWIE